MTQENLHSWQTKKLSEICDFQRGLTYSKEDEVDFSNNIVLRANNINMEKNILDFTELKYIKDEILIHENKKVKVGSLVICTASGSKSHLGKVALIDKQYDYAFGGFMGQITPKDEIDSKFLFYIFTSEAYKDLIGRLSDGVNINNLKFSDLEDFPIPLPPLPEQLRIVSILDEALKKLDQAKENIEKNLQNAKEVFESYLQSIFANPGEDWEVKRLWDKELIQIIDGDRGKNYPKKSDFLDEWYCLFLSTKNVRPNGFSFETTMFITEEKNKMLGNGIIQRNDVLLTTRGTIGNIAVYDKDVPFECIRINSWMLIFRPNIKLIVPEYLFAIFQSEIMKTQIKEFVSGAAQPQLPIKTLVNFSIPVPKNISQQLSIVSQLNTLSIETKRLESIYQQKLAHINELRKSLLKKAFADEL